MGNTPIAYIDAFGIHKPAFADELAYYTSVFQGAFGADIYIPADSQDGQFIGLLALALDDTNNCAIGAYNAFSPTTAQGTGLASVVKINGIAKKIPSYSTCPVLIVGQALAPINNGLASDINGYQWALPASVVIPSSGQITVTATCTTLGAIAAAPNSIKNIDTPTYGWQTVNNILPATTGQPVEQDDALKQRQAVSAGIPSLTQIQSITAQILALEGVTSCIAYVNETDITDDNMVPAYSIAMIVAGGNDLDVATIISNIKAPGVPTYGNVSVAIVDAFGISRNYNFIRLNPIPITVALVVTALQGFTSDVETQIQNSVVAYINALGTQDVLTKRLYIPAQLNGGVNSNTFELQDLQIARDGLTPSESDITIALTEQPYCAMSFVTIQVLPP